MLVRVDKYCTYLVEYVLHAALRKFVFTGGGGT